MKNKSVIRYRVPYADTDQMGVVYYANYLRWLEMARCDLVDELGLSIAEYARQGFLFTVAHLEIDYLAPAVLGDEIEIVTTVQRVRHVRFTLEQRVLRLSDEVELVKASVMLACVGPEGKLTAMPKELAAALRGLME